MSAKRIPWRDRPAHYKAPNKAVRKVRLNIYRLNAGKQWAERFQHHD